MDIIGGGRVFTYPAGDESPHTPGPEKNWQESFVLIWMDMEQKVGGFFRLGHEPNWQGGRTQFMSNIFSPEGTYHRASGCALRPQDRMKNGFANGEDTLRYEYEDETIRWQLSDNGVSADLVVDSFVPPIDAHKREGQQNAFDYTGNHVDAACGVSGTVSVKGRTWQVSGIGLRDHGWGPRDWTGLVAHRWTLGTFDCENSFVAMTFLLTSGQLAKFGWVIRGDNVIFAEDVTIRATIGHDGGTNYGGTTRMTLTTGEILEASFEPIYPCIASKVHETICYDSMSKVRWGDKVGFGIFESSITADPNRPPFYEGSTGPDGWYDGFRLVQPL